MRSSGADMELRWYYTVLRRWWQLIMAGALLTALVALLVSLVLPRTYVAVANVLLLKSRVDVTIDPRLDTLSEDEIVRLTNPDVRRQTLATLAVSGPVFEQSLRAMPADLQKVWTVAHLSQRAAVKTPGNIIQLSVQARDAAEAALVVNVWADTFIHFTNTAYGQSNQGALATDQVGVSLATYQTAQTALEDFLANNQIDELTLAINVREQAIQNIKTAYQTTQVNGLNDQLAARQRLPLLLESAQALRQQLTAQPGDATLPASTQVALIILEANALTSGVTLPAQLQLDLTAVSPDTPLKAGEAVRLIDSLTASMTTLQQSLTNTTLTDSAEALQSPDLNPALADTVRGLQVRLDELRAQLEDQLARRRELTAARDLQWDSYQLVQKQATETTLLSAASDTEVVLSAPAIVPPSPSAPNLLLNVAIGGLLGLAATLSYAFLQAQLGLTAPAIRRPAAPDKAPRSAESPQHAPGPGD